MYVLCPMRTMTFSGRPATQRLNAPMRSCRAQDTVIRGPTSSRTRQMQSHQHGATNAVGLPHTALARTQHLTRVETRGRQWGEVDEL